jgi:hypothetical protein
MTRTARTILRARIYVTDLKLDRLQERPTNLLNPQISRLCARGLARADYSARALHVLPC